MYGCVFRKQIYLILIRSMDTIVHRCVDFPIKLLLQKSFQIMKLKEDFPFYSLLFCKFLFYGLIHCVDGKLFSCTTSNIHSPTKLHDCLHKTLCPMNTKAL